MQDGGVQGGGVRGGGVQDGGVQGGGVQDGGVQDGGVQDGLLEHRGWELLSTEVSCVVITRTNARNSKANKYWDGILNGHTIHRPWEV